jgi:hypothetical protein
VTPILSRRTHLSLLFVWAALLPPSIVLWRESIVWVVAMSHYACLATHWAGWEAAKVEVKQEEDSPS